MMIAQKQLDKIKNYMLYRSDIAQRYTRHYKVSIKEITNIRHYTQLYVSNIDPNDCNISLILPLEISI